MKDLITPETAKAILERRELKERGIITTEDHELYAKLNREDQRMCRKDKTDYINKICCELELHSKKNQTKDLYRKLNELTKTRSTKYCGPNTTKYIWFWSDGERTAQNCITLESDQSLSHGTRLNRSWTSFLQRWRAIAALKCEKTPGKDGIPAELIKQLGPRGTRMITDICNNIWATGRWPEDWTESVFIPLHKKGSKIGRAHV